MLRRYRSTTMFNAAVKALQQRLTRYQVGEDWGSMPEAELTDLRWVVIVEEPDLPPLIEASGIEKDMLQMFLSRMIEEVDQQDVRNEALRKILKR